MRKCERERPRRRLGPSRSPCSCGYARGGRRSEEHTSELQSQSNLVCRLLLEKKKKRPRFCRLAASPRHSLLIPLRGHTFRLCRDIQDTTPLGQTMLIPLSHASYYTSRDTCLL